MSAVATPTAKPADTPASIEAAQRRLRSAAEALRGRPRDDTLASLGRLLELWRDPNSQLRKQLETELPRVAGFREATVREGLRHALESWHGDALTRLVQRELAALGGASLHGFAQTSVLLAGSIPMPSLLAILLPLALHSPVLAKTASRDPLTAQLVAASLRDIDPLLGACLEVVSFPSNAEACSEALLASPCVVATGGDDTIAAIAGRVPPTTRFIGYGHRLSLAAIGERALGPDAPETAAGLALDIALWDQQGCLSPLAVYCEGGAAAASELAAALAAALADAEERWPRGELATAAAARFRSELDLAEMRRADGRDIEIHCDSQQRWAVVREDGPEPRPSPLNRFVRVHGVADRSALHAAISPFAPHLAGVAVAGFGAQTQEWASALAALGASRVCAPGSLQAPPLDWHHDGRPLLLPLGRVSDDELAS